MFKNISWSRLSFLFLVLTLSGQAQTDELAQAFERGAAAFQRGQYEQALFEYRAALQWPGDHQARAHFNIGVCQHKLGRKQEAGASYRRALDARNGAYASAAYALGITLQDQRQFREARAAFAQAVKASGGKHAEALFELGLEAQRADDDQAAIEHYRQAIVQSKDRLPACHNNLGVLLIKFGQLDEAQRAFETALARARGDFIEASDNLARCQQLRDAATRRMIAQFTVSEGAPATLRSE